MSRVKNHTQISQSWLSPKQACRTQ